MRRDDNAFLAIMRAGGYPYRAVRRPLTTQRDGFGRKLRRDGNIEFQAAGYDDLIISGAQ